MELTKQKQNSSKNKLAIMLKLISAIEYCKENTGHFISIYGMSIITFLLISISLKLFEIRNDKSYQKIILYLICSFTLVYCIDRATVKHRSRDFINYSKTDIKT